MQQQEQQVQTAPQTTTTTQTQEEYDSLKKLAQLSTDVLNVLDKVIKEGDEAHRRSTFPKRIIYQRLRTAYMEGYNRSLQENANRNAFIRFIRACQDGKKEQNKLLHDADRL